MIRKMLSAALTIAAACSTALAQAQAQSPTDTWQAPNLDPRSVAIPYVYALVGLAVICLAAFKSTGRTHLD